ncbi:MAG TPA: amidohydrolase family protein [Vicinamibacteria bacterium]|nr:amidohydrolase family protein [Vicinamibacteria bacterium]
MLRARVSVASMFAWLCLVVIASGQPEIEHISDAPTRAEGDGPFNRLILRGVTLIDGTGAPPVGPVDIVVEKNRIARIESVGFPGVAIDPALRPKAEPGDKELDLEGHYLLPGFVDLHGHIGGVEQGTPAEYVLKLWMGHGITTICDPSTGNGLDWVLAHKEKSLANTITAPRIEAYPAFGQGHDGPMATTEIARVWVGTIAAKGADGIKFFGARPDIMGAAIDEANKHGLRTTCHHAQLNVAWLDALDSARLGLTSMQHWYGLPEALFEDKTIQHYPLDYNYNNEQHRFVEAGRLWRQAAAPYSDHWSTVMNELIELDFTLSPTFVAYETTRDFMRMARAEWHEEYTLPSLWRFYAPNREKHASYWYYWTTEIEVDWKQNYQLWMTFVNEYKNRGGRVAIGSDSGYSYNLYGFGHIREMELLREAGFHPLEVFRAATLKGAETLGLSEDIGTIEVGKFADMVVVEENPLENIKVLYGTGAVKLDENNDVVRVGGVKYTIKDGIIFDAKKLLADVRRIVAEAKARENFQITQPGRPTPEGSR